MKKEYYEGNRKRLFDLLPVGSAAVYFSGEEVCKTNDEAYAFYAERNFLYLTGITQKESVLLLVKESESDLKETLYLLPPDPMVERWTGRRIKPPAAEAASGISDIRSTTAFEGDFRKLINFGSIQQVFLDLYKVNPLDRDRPAHGFLRKLQSEAPFLSIGDGSRPLQQLRLLKQPCEIEALRKAEIITGQGIVAMMQHSRLGMYEHQYKAHWDYALSQHGPRMDGFPAIISAGENNFCIHYYDYTGIARDGDMVLADVGAQYDGLTTDVSRGFPCNGKFSDRQKLLFDCMLETSNHMFSIIKPGMKMADVDGTIRRYNAQLLKDAGVIDHVSEVGRVMWHGGAHHIGLDVHDPVETPEIIGPNMVFCVDIGIYHEEWGIGFRLEDNCLVTETGCENLSAAIPRTPEDIEAVMPKC